jgi:hypothetical protein
VRRSPFILLVSVLTVVLLAPQALAANPHFIRNATSATQTAANEVTVTFKLAGLGAGEAVDVTASVPVLIEEQCVNRGGNEPQAANKQRTQTTVTETERFIADEHGHVVGTIVLTAPEGSLVCPPGQTKTSTTTFGDVTLSAPQVRRSLTLKVQ